MKVLAKENFKSGGKYHKKGQLVDVSSDCIDLLLSKGLIELDGACGEGGESLPSPKNEQLLDEGDLDDDGEDLPCSEEPTPKKRGRPKKKVE